jgi:hypothetical protein
VLDSCLQWKWGRRARTGAEPSSNLLRAKRAAITFFIRLPSPAMPRNRSANYAQVRLEAAYASCRAARPIIPKHNKVPMNHNPLRAYDHLIEVVLT